MRVIFPPSHNTQEFTTESQRTARIAITTKSVSITIISANTPIRDFRVVVMNPMAGYKVDYGHSG